MSKRKSSAVSVNNPKRSKYSAGRSSNIIDIVSHTHRSISNFTHLWIIDGFPSYLDDPDPDPKYFLRSPVFLLPNQFATRDSPSENSANDLSGFHLICFPQMNSYDDPPTQVMMQLEYISGSKDIKVRADIVLLQEGENDEEISDQTADNHYYMYRNFSSFNEICLREFYLSPSSVRKALGSNDKLRILTKISILDDAVNDPIKYSCSRKQKDRNETRFDVHPRLMFHFKELLYSGQMADVEIVVTREKEPVIFKAHRLILSARSPVFKAMFTTPLMEGRTGRIEMCDFSQNTIKSMLHFMYTGQLTDDSNKMELFRAADKYFLSDLRERLELVLSSQIDIENAAEMFFEADLVRSAFLKKESLDFIVANRTNVIAGNGWKKFVACFPDLVTDVVLATHP